MSFTPSPLVTIEGVQAYLASTPFASHTIIPLSGGSANFAYRIHLQAPIDHNGTLVLKFAEPYVKNLKTLAISVDRQRFEYEAMTRIKAWLPPDSLVTVPTIYKFDAEQHVLIMEDCGTNVLTLKQFYQEGLVPGSRSVDLAEVIGASLGRFIGGMHAWSRADPDGILGVFAKHTQAQQLTAWAFYERLVSTLTGDDVPPVLTDPLLEVKEEDVEIMKRVADQMSKAITSAHDTFVMGDFWPGNMMVVVNADQKLERLYILDWEMAKAGLPGCDVGQFCAEMDLLKRFVPAAADTSSAVLRSFMQAYAKEFQPSAEVAWNALVHWSAHLVVWTPRVPWGDKMATRRVVEDGTRLVVEAAQSAEGDLSKSLVGILISESG